MKYKLKEFIIKHVPANQLLLDKIDEKAQALGYDACPRVVLREWVNKGYTSYTCTFFSSGERDTTFANKPLSELEKESLSLEEFFMLSKDDVEFNKPFGEFAVHDQSGELIETIVEHALNIGYTIDCDEFIKNGATAIYINIAGIICEVPSWANSLDRMGLADFFALSAPIFIENEG